MDGEATPAVFDDLSEGQIYGPTKTAHAWPKPWTNIESQENVQLNILLEVPFDNSVIDSKGHCFLFLCVRVYGVFGP